MHESRCTEVEGHAHICGLRTPRCTSECKIKLQERQQNGVFLDMPPLCRRVNLMTNRCPQRDLLFRSEVRFRRQPTVKRGGITTPSQGPGDPSGTNAK